MKQKDATSKEVAETTENSEAVAVSEAETPSEAVVKSDVGPVTKQVVFDKLIKVCMANNIDPLDLAEMLMEYDSVSASEETKAAA
jgi:predicted Fe-Mo cluster-binding NifX family protein